ncbi:hypothetical protein FWG76_01045 [Candidatus Saccharibacteria bacterium]|nr:hypothetical protein [Candidatus Saccharibacteria bacterium]
MTTAQDLAPRRLSERGSARARRSDPVATGGGDGVLSGAGSARIAGKDTYGKF